MSETGTEGKNRPTADDGWLLDKRSWRFHRSVWRKAGRALAFAEYTRLASQIRTGQAEMLRFDERGSLYRVAMDDGTPIDLFARQKLLKNGKPCIELIQAVAFWGRRVAPEPALPAPEKPVHMEVPPAPPPEPPPPPPAPSRRASTLTLGTKSSSAAELLAARLRPAPLPPRVEKAAPPPTKKRARRLA